MPPRVAVGPDGEKAPIIASTDAASTSRLPKSKHSGMKRVWTNPFVDRPRTKRVPNGIQNTRPREASPSAANAGPTVPPPDPQAGVGADPVSP